MKAPRLTIAWTPCWILEIWGLGMEYFPTLFGHDYLPRPLSKEGLSRGTITISADEAILDITKKVNGLQGFGDRSWEMVGCKTEVDEDDETDTCKLPMFSKEGLQWWLSVRNLWIFSFSTAFVLTVVALKLHASVRYFDDDGEITQSMPLGLPTISLKECLTFPAGLKGGHSCRIFGWWNNFLDFIPIWGNDC